jgi:hypothetical protein
MIYYSTDNGQTREKLNYCGNKEDDSALQFTEAIGCDLAEEVGYKHQCEDAGANSNWPITVILYESEDGPEVARFEVDRDFQAIFTATEIEKSDDAK